MRDTLPGLFDSYYGDLASLGHLVAADLAEDRALEVGLLAKLAVETARVLVYEQFFLLPAVRDAVPDGAKLARDEAGQLGEVAARMQALERLAPGDPEFRRAFGDYLRSSDELGERRRETLLPALDAALSDDDLAELGSRVTGTAEPGSTHSEPSDLKRHALDWPRPGFLNAMINVFADEVQTRHPGLSPVRL